MAGETPALTAEQLKEIDEASKNAADSMSLFNNMTNQAAGALGGLDDKIKNASTELEGMSTAMTAIGQAYDFIGGKIGKYSIETSQAGKVSRETATEFGIMTTALLGTRVAFDQLRNIDTGNLNTFSSQWKSLSDTILKGGGTISTVIEKAETILGKKLPAEVIAGGIMGITSFMNNMMKGADNSLRTQNAMIQLAAQTGNLGKVYKIAGENLGNVNELIAQHRMAVVSAAEATSMLPEQVEKMYSELGTIPGTLDASVDASSKMAIRGSESISMLSGSILVAVGSGRKYEDVIADLKTAYREYGLTGNEALKFTAEIGEVANKTGVELEVVRNALLESSKAFSKFADTGEGATRMASGLSRVMNEYTQRLKDTGMSGPRAISVVQDMTSAMDKMSIAQKAFLSAQSGGPGGMRGAFQIENMLAEGKSDEVFKMQLQSLKQQMGGGPIVTRKEAAESDAAADQMVKQTLLIRQGPLGGMAKSDQDAYRIADMLKAMDEGKNVEEMQNDIVKSTMDKGIEIQDKSLTELQRMRIVLERQMAAADITNLSAIQRYATAGSGEASSESTDERVINYKKGLQRGVGKGGYRSAQLSTRLKGEMETEQIDMNAFTAGEEVYSNAQSIKSFMGAAYAQAQKATGNVVSKAHSKWEEWKKKFAAAKTEKEKAEIRVHMEQAQKEAEDAQKMMNQSREQAASILGNNQPGGIGVDGRLLPARANTDAEDVAPGATVANAARQAPGAVNAAARAARENNTPVPGQGGGGGTVVHEHKVEVTGYCLKCKNEIEGGRQHSKNVNTTGGTHG